MYTIALLKSDECCISMNITNIGICLTLAHKMKYKFLCLQISNVVNCFFQVIQNEISLSSLQQCIKKVRDGPPCLPSVCLYSLANATPGYVLDFVSKTLAY